MSGNKILLVLIAVLVLAGVGAVIVGINLNQQGELPQTGECALLTSSYGSCRMTNPPTCYSTEICTNQVSFPTVSKACAPGQMFLCSATGPTCSNTNCGVCEPECGDGEEIVAPANGQCPTGTNITQGICSACNNPYWGCCRPKTETKNYKCGEPDVANGVFCKSEDDCEDFVNATMKTCNADGTCTTTTQRLAVECNLKYIFGDAGNNGICALRDEQCGELGYSADGYCGCTKTVTTPTPTPTPTPSTKTPTPTTKTPTPTPTITNPPVTTVIPETALISDEADRVLIGAALLVFGMVLFRTGAHIQIGRLYFGIVSGSFKDAHDKKKILSERASFENNFSED